MATSSTSNFCNVSNAIFLNVYRNQSGGVISIKGSTMNLLAKWNIFDTCGVGSQLYGGCICSISQGTFSISFSCARNCYAYRGFFFYVDSNNNDNIVPLLEMNETSATFCNGEDRAVCANYYSDLLSSYYNSSNCKAGLHCDVQTWYSDHSEVYFYQFCNCENDILYGSDTKGQDNIAAYINLIANRKSNGECGLIHTNYYEDTVLTTKNVYAYQNEHTLFNAMTGVIIIESLICDSFTSSGNSISTDNVNTNPNLELSVTFSDTLFCKLPYKTVPKRAESGYSIRATLFVAMYLLL